MQEEHPFVDHIHDFKKVKKEDRAAELRRINDTPQGQGKCPEFKESYPNQGKWTYNQHEIHYHYAQRTEGVPTAVLFYFHGMNAHGGGSGYLAMNLVRKCGVDAYAHDFTNFGQSKGPFRGLIESMDAMVSEAQSFMEFILSKYVDKPKVYIAGLSLGGAVCFHLSLKAPQLVDGVIFLSPALRENTESQPFMKKVGWLIGAVLPRMKLVNQTFGNQNKLDVMDRINADPYVYKDKVVPGSVKVVLDAMSNSEKDWGKFDRPFIMVQSGVDKLVDPFQAIDFEEACKSKDKTVIYCKNMWHSVFCEQEFPAVTEIIVNWLNRRLTK